MQIETLMLRMSGLLSRIATPAEFNILSGHQESFNETLVSWLTDPAFDFSSRPNGTASIVGLCCSSLLGIEFREEDSTSEDLIIEFRRFLLATSLLHSGFRGSKDGECMTDSDLCTAAQISGSRLLKKLDRTLTPQYLSGLGKEACQVLFLLVLGTVLGIHYTISPQFELSSRVSPLPPQQGRLNSSLNTSASHSSPADALLYSELPKRQEGQRLVNRTADDFAHSPTLWFAMREHLCQMLAHHLIYLGSMLGIRFSTDMEQRIIDEAVRGWGKAGDFVWGEVVQQVVDDTQKGKEIEVTEMDGCMSGTRENIKAMVEKDREVLVQKEEEPRDTEYRNPPYWEDDRPPPHPPPPTTTTTHHPPPSMLVPIACPELSQFKQEKLDHWAENPTSYLDMADEPMSYEEPQCYDFGGKGNGVELSRGAPYSEGHALPRSQTEPIIAKLAQNDDIPRQRVKRRTMWVVRPFDAGPHGQINVHARLRGRDVHDFGVFV